MIPIQSKTVRVDGLELHYLEAGQGAPVLFVHGWPTNAQLWRHVLPVVGAARRAIAIDLPGFGLSSKPLDVRYGFSFFENAIDGLLNALRIETLGLAVHDLGGPAGLYWAAKNTARVTDLAILNTLVFPELSWAVKAFILSTHLPGSRSFITSPRGLKLAMRFGVENKAHITDEVAHLYQRPFTDAASRKALLKTGQGMGVGGFRFIAKSLAQFTMPAALIYGECDRILPDVANTMARIKEIMPQANVHPLADCGHFLQEDSPDEVAQLLADFFSQARG